MTLPRTLLAVAVVCLIVAPAAHAITLGQVDDFEDSSVANWNAGGTPVSNSATGGPAGLNDNYLELETSSADGPGSRVGIRNLSQWLGDYTAAGVTGIRVDLNNLSSESLEIRILIDGDGGAFASSTAFALGGNSGWVTATFDMTASGLTSVGGATLADTLGNVTNILIHHDPGTPDGFGPNVPAVPVGTIVGFDNIAAVPEPGTIALLAAGVGTLALRRRRKA